MNDKIWPKKIYSVKYKKYYIEDNNLYIHPDGARINNIYKTQIIKEWDRQNPGTTLAYEDYLEAIWKESLEEIINE